MSVKLWRLIGNNEDWFDEFREEVANEHPVDRADFILELFEEFLRMGVDLRDLGQLIMYIIEFSDETGEYIPWKAEIVQKGSYGQFRYYFQVFTNTPRVDFPAELHYILEIAYNKSRNRLSLVVEWLGKLLPPLDVTQYVINEIEFTGEMNRVDEVILITLFDLYNIDKEELEYQPDGVVETFLTPDV